MFGVDVRNLCLKKNFFAVGKVKEKLALVLHLVKEVKKLKLKDLVCDAGVVKVA